MLRVSPRSTAVASSSSPAGIARERLNSKDAPRLGHLNAACQHCSVGAYSAAKCYLDATCFDEGVGRYRTERKRSDEIHPLLSTVFPVRTGCRRDRPIVPLAIPPALT